MKTKIFKHKLLAVGTLAALGLCMGGTALAGAKSYSTNEITTLISVKDAQGNNITLDDLEFQATASNDSNSNINQAPGPDDDTDASALGSFNSEACVGEISPANPNCKVTKPNIFTQHPIGPGNVFCRGKASILSFAPTDDPNLTVEDGGVSVATAECQFDRENDGLGGSRNSFSAGFTVGPDQDGTTLSFEFLADPRMEVFCHQDLNFLPNATAAMTVTITVTTDTGEPVFSFNPDGVVDAALGQTKDEADLNLNRFCNARGEVIEYDPIVTPQGINDCQGGDFPNLCEYAATTQPLPPGEYRMVVEQNQRTSANKVIPPFVAEGDHFLCYKSFGHFLREEVNLFDQFEDKNFKVLKPKMFCNPAIKPELDPNAELAENPHYQSYKIKKGHRVKRHVSRMAEVTNQFGTMIVETIRPDRLMVPSGKSVVLPGIPTLVPPIPPAGLKTNHYKCYTVRADDFQQRNVVVLDQFSLNGKELVLVRPKRLCTPVEKTRSNGDVTPTILDPVLKPFDHLMCYMVRAARGERLHKKTKVLSNNQFRTEELVLKRELEFCVPSSKRLL